MVRFLTTPPPPPPKESAQLRSEFRLIPSLTNDPCGQLCVRDDKPFLIIPWSTPPASLTHEALIFLDESYDEQTKTFFFGGLAFTRLKVLLASLAYLGALLNVKQSHGAFWQDTELPPRLHLRELQVPEALAKTKWAFLKRNTLDSLIRGLLLEIVRNSAARIIIPISTKALADALESSFPHEENSIDIPQLRLSVAAQLLRKALAETIRPDIALETVIDYDKTAVKVGNRKKQATLHFMTSLQPSESQKETKPALVYDRSEKHSSFMPKEFVYAALAGNGAQMRLAINSIGLQFTDLYLGLWRQVIHSKRPSFGLEPKHFGRPTIHGIKG